jgi:hypothetical protein
LVCISLYAIRYFYRGAYGLLEILIGVILIWKTSTSAAGVPDIDLRAIQLAGGMYIFIRGMDNLVTWGGSLFARIALHRASVPVAAPEQHDKSIPPV